MGRTFPACLSDESLRICVDVLRILEAGVMRMHARDYRDAATQLHEAFACLGVDELLAIARSARPVLAEAAEAVLYAYGCEDQVDTSAERRLARLETQRLLGRLRHPRVRS
ncbi:MAG TPA: hypothetical protein VNV16_05760 [Methylibium sp.]|nr:hypothetical protein [Methylibium sp.]